MRRYGQPRPSHGHMLRELRLHLRLGAGESSAPHVGSAHGPLFAHLRLVCHASPPSILVRLLWSLGLLMGGRISGRGSSLDPTGQFFGRPLIVDLLASVGVAPPLQRILGARLAPMRRWPRYTFVSWVGRLPMHLIAEALLSRRPGHCARHRVGACAILDVNARSRLGLCAFCQPGQLWSGVCPEFAG